LKHHTLEIKFRAMAMVIFLKL